MYVFDTLIFNEARSLDRMLYDTGDWRLLLVGHDRSFGTKSGRPPHLAQVGLAVSRSWKDALSALTEDRLERELGDVLDKRRRRALLKRRDELLEF